MARWFVMGWFSFVTWLLFVSRVACVGSHFVCGFRVCSVCWVLSSHRDVCGSSHDVHFVVSRRGSHSFVSVWAQWCVSRRESRRESRE